MASRRTRYERLQKETGQADLLRGDLPNIPRTIRLQVATHQTDPEVGFQDLSDNLQEGRVQMNVLKV